MKTDWVFNILMTLSAVGIVIGIAGMYVSAKSAVCIDGMLMKSRGDYYVSLNKECVIKEQVAK